MKEQLDLFCLLGGFSFFENCENNESDATRFVIMTSSAWWESHRYVQYSTYCTVQTAVGLSAEKILLWEGKVRHYMYPEKSMVSHNMHTL